MEHIRNVLQNILKLREQFIRWRRKLLPLAAIVVFATTYALILPAITLDDSTANDTPGIQVAKTSADDVSTSSASGLSSGQDSSKHQDADDDKASKADGPYASNNATGSDDDHTASDDAENKQESDTVTSSAGTVRAKTEDDQYKVVASYGSDAGLPDGTVLKVKELKNRADDYQHAKDAVVAARKQQSARFKESDLGFKALDIGFYDAAGNKVEPKAKVDVRIEAKNLPKKAAENGISVQHIVKKADLKSAAKDDSQKLKNIDKSPSAHGLVAQSVGGKTKVDAKRTGTATFSVESFSVFTITWSQGASSEGTRIANVKIHYVDTDGKELETPTIEPTEDMLEKNENGIVALDDYAKSEGASRVEHYTYQGARMSNAASGEAITGLMAKATTVDSKTTYSLEYTQASPVPTSSDDATWMEVPADAITGAKTNSVDVYLVYKEDDHITVHYVDGGGDAIADSATKYLSDDSVKADAGISLAAGDGVNTDWAKDIANYTYDSAHLGNVVGDTVAAVKSVADGDGYKLQVKRTSDGDFADAAATDLYLVYNKTNAKKVEVYYTDIAGKPILDKSGNPIKKTYDPTDWSGGTHSFIDDAKAYTPDGYAAFSGNTGNGSNDPNAMNKDDIPNWWEGGNDRQDNANTQNRILYVTDDDVGLGLQVLRNVRGVQIDGATYQNGQLIFTRSGQSSGSTSDQSSKSSCKVYIMYKPIVLVHDFDTDGNSLGEVRNGGTVSYYGANRWNGNTFDPSRAYWDSSINSIGESSLANSSYGSVSRIEVKDASGTVRATITDAAQISNFKLTWQFEGPKSWNTRTQGYINDSDDVRAAYHWKTRIYTGTGNVAGTDYQEIDGLLTDVSITYSYAMPLSVTVHHVDESGKKIADDSTESVNSSSDSALTMDTFKKTDITNYTAVSVKYGNDFTSANPFVGITFTKNSSNWQYALNDSAISADVSPGDAVYVVYTAKTDGRSVTIHYVDENGNELAKPVVTSFAVRSDATRGNGSAIYKGSDGSPWNGGTFVTRSEATNGASGIASNYSFVGEYLGPTFNMDKDKLVNDAIRRSGNSAVQWHYESGNSDSSKDGWYTSHASSATNRHGLTDAGVFHEYITDIYWVYAKQPQTLSNITLHYIHPTYNTSGTAEANDGTPTYQKFTNNASGAADRTLTYDQIAATKDNGVNLATNPNQQETGDTSEYSKDITENGDDANNNGTYNYYSSYLATPNSAGLPSYARLMTDAPNIKRVRVHNGKYQFLVVSGDGLNRPMTQIRRNQWSYTTTGGRTYTLRKSGNNYTMLDSQAGRSAYDLNLTSTSENTGDDGTKTTTNIYSSKFSVEDTGLVYEIREVVTTPQSGRATTQYDVTVHEWAGVSQTHIYQLYTKHSDTPTVEISNEVVYSGNLVARVSNLGSDQEIESFIWQKKIGDNGDWVTVDRNQNGSDWNIASDEASRSWLNLAADDGELSRSEGRTKVQYQVTLKYKDQKSGEEKTTVSQVFDVPYWDQLENGSFETPDLSQTVTLQNGSTAQNTGSGYQFSNSDYKYVNGVWQTTGVGTGGHTGQDIEIVNDRDNGFRQSYYWKNNLNDGAQDGHQFAELNCEASGALYQDVVTHPNEYLNYWLSHRARGGSGGRANSTLYDSMYLVIMPTKQAMTSASTGGELSTQSDLVKFINEHTNNGYDKNNVDPGKEEDQVMYRDTNSGVLIVKISSDNNDWHNINVANGYLATSSMTRFFFVAGHTASGNQTVGNFLDNVGFSQRLQTPTTPHYHMVVTKTFNGLTTDEVAKLASNKAADGKAFKLNIDEYTDADGNNKSSTTYEQDAENNKYDTLNGATLSFTTDSSNNFTLTAEGVDPEDPTKKVDLLDDGSGSTGVVSEDPATGAITMTWTLYNNYFPATPTQKYFKVTEDNAEIDDYSSTSTNDAVVEHGKEGADPASTSYESNSETKLITVQDQDTVRVNYTNSYRDSKEDGTPFITVQKTFSGATPAEVREMLSPSGNNGKQYQLVVTKPDGTSPITLIGGNDAPYYSGDLPAGVQGVQFSTRVGTDGKTTATWNILGTTENNSWVTNGTYSVKEVNYTSDINGKPKVTVGNGVTPGSSDVLTSDGSWPSSDPTVKVGDANASKLTFPSITDPNVTKADPSLNVSGTNSSAEVQLPVATNVIVGRYTPSGTNTPNYLVWTLDALGQSDRAKIIEQINKVLSGANATEETTHFQNSQNPDVVNGGAGYMDLRYDSGQMFLTLVANGSGTWTGYYATEYDNAGSPEIAVANSYEPAVKVMKVSSDERQTPLEGAEFQLFTYDGDTKKYFVSNKTFSDTGVRVTFTTNDDGIAQSSVSGNNALQIISGLKNGTYYLEETKAPNGYDMPGKNIVAVNVDSDGIASLVTDTSRLTGLSEDVKAKVNTSTSGTDAVTIDWDRPYYTITVQNTSGVILPSTGGKGDLPFRIAGMVLIVAALAGAFVMRRRGRWS